MTCLGGAGWVNELGVFLAHSSDIDQEVFS